MGKKPSATKAVARKPAKQARKRQKLPRPLVLSPSGNGSGLPKGQAKTRTVAKKSVGVAGKRGPATIHLLALPKGKHRGIGELSFGKRPRKPRATRARRVEVAGSPADRVMVTDTKQSPWRKICDLLITARDGTLHTGTAWFISPRTLVTAGHCISVFRPGTPAHGMVNSILIMPARNGENDAAHSAFGWLQVTPQSLQVHPGWANAGQLDFDYGAIILPPSAPLGAQVGFFGYGHFSDQQLDESATTISGYPDNVPDGTQWFETNRIKEVTPTRISYDIFTFAGQSGSPVFFGNSAKQIACAIHNFGGAPFNSGVRINPQVVAQLNAWRF